MPETYFSEDQKDQIVKAIEQAELDSSGEIRVHIDRACKGDVMDRAAYIFQKLEMHKTELRNGVLFYVSLKDRKFAILGDAGINALVPEGFWDAIKEKMIARFKEGKIIEALTEGILMAGKQLQSHFPYKKGEDINELSDEISFG
jgi:uncharacterized membrane protein